LSFAALDAPTGRPGNRPGFKARREMAMTCGGKPQAMARAVTEHDLTRFLKFIGTCQAHFRLEKGKFTV
jgi:hypothetical protein